MQQCAIKSGNANKKHRFYGTLRPRIERTSYFFARATKKDRATWMDVVCGAVLILIANAFAV